MANQISRTKTEQVITTISNLKPKILLRGIQMICRVHTHSMDPSNKNSKLIITFLCIVGGVSISKFLNKGGVYCGCFLIIINPLSANPTKWSNTLKQFVGESRWIVWVCLTILWGWRLKGWMLWNYIMIHPTITHQKSNLLINCKFNSIRNLFSTKVILLLFPTTWKLFLCNNFLLIIFLDSEDHIIVIV